MKAVGRDVAALGAFTVQWQKEERASRCRAEAERIRRKAASTLISQSDRDQLLEIAEQYDLLAATERSGFPFD